VADRIEMNGLSVSPGMTASHICLYSHGNYQKAALRIRKVNLNPDKELERFESARLFCSTEIQNLRTRVAQEIGEAEASVLDAQLALLNDTAIDKEVAELIRHTAVPFEEAVEIVFASYEKRFAALDSDYFKDRSSDISEVKLRLLNFAFKTEPGFVCSGPKSCSRGKKAVIVAEELTASMLMEIDLGRIKGIVTERGGVNGHAALLARSAGIPAITGVAGAMDHARCGNAILIKATEGVVIFNPSESDLTELTALEQESYTAEPSVPGTAVYANCSSLDSVISAREHGADGIGLFRTEMLFFKAGKILSESEQEEIYLQTLEIMDGKPVTFRLLDIGGDKSSSFIAHNKEENPFLGFRGSRFLLGNPEILTSQIRALLKASQSYPLRIMLPMIVDTVQFEQLRDIIYAEAQMLNISMKQVELGVMFEVPSAVFQAEELMEMADFGSIGSNDLLQYLFAVDRNNELVAHAYDMNHPVLWKCMDILAQTASRFDKQISICGELASYPGFASKLNSIGITNLSVSPQLIRQVRHELNQAVESTLV